MTCREKLQIEHPGLINDKYPGGCSGCPNHYGYLERPDYCPHNEHGLYYGNVCSKCWDREIDEEPVKDDSKTIMDIVANAMNTKDMRIDLYFGDSGITCNIYPCIKD